MALASMFLGALISYTRGKNMIHTQINTNGTVSLVQDGQVRTH